MQAVVADAAARGDARPDVDPKTVATLIVATLEGALMMSRLEQSDDALRRVHQHLIQYLETEVAVARRGAPLLAPRTEPKPT
jgi:TetR/AcrR family transcriptional repressor of nem operon